MARKAVGEGKKGAVADAKEEVAGKECTPKQQQQRVAPDAQAAVARRARGAAADDNSGRAVIIVTILLVGVLPLVVLYLPLLIPPGDAVNGSTTMVGGTGVDGVLGLYSVANRFGVKFCAEHGARDTVKCYLNVAILVFEMLKAPAYVDVYTAIPLAGYALEAARFEHATSPLHVDAQWVEGTVDATGVVAAQISKAFLDYRDKSHARLPPLTTRQGAVGFAPNAGFACEQPRLEFNTCHEIFKDVFGVERTPVFGHAQMCAAERGPDPAALADAVARDVWGGRPRKLFYVFGIESATALLRSIPRLEDEHYVVNVVVLPLADKTHTWETATRGRKPCEDKFFHDSYDLTYNYFRWVVEGDRSPSAPKPKPSS